jgi:hypothetical protein
MAFKTFRSFCEALDATAAYKTGNPDATASYRPNVNSNFTHPQNKSFEQAADPLVNDFVQKILHGTLSQDHPHLEPVQIEYILEKVKEGLSNLQYDAKNDLGNIINNLWRNANRPKPVDTPNNRADETPPLANSISKLFRRR